VRQGKARWVAPLGSAARRRSRSSLGGQTDDRAPIHATA
jgi:hypothetical protein